MGQMTAIFKQTGRNLKQTWGTQIMTLFTVSLSVLIFSFFFLVYLNIMKGGEKLENDLRIIVYLENEIVPEMQVQMTKKIREFTEVERVVYVSKDEAFKRLEGQLGADRDVLAGLASDFLPPALEVYPQKNLRSLTQIKELSEYLATLPGISKVQYGQSWLERFGYFTKLLRFIVLISGGLLILTTTFIVSYTIRLTVATRHDELEALRLLGAHSLYIQGPLILEGLLQGLFGSTFGLILLYSLYQWIITRFSGPGFLNFLDFTFLSPLISGLILLTGTLLCVGGSMLSIRKALRI